MKRSTVINIISGLLSFLFIYTGTSKLLEHSSFLAQLQAFPLLHYYPLLFSFLVPFTELVIAFGLIFNQTTLPALRASLVLLIVFTAYLVLMIFTNKDLPCSCGGIISTMSWKQHILFNLFLLFLTAFAINRIKKERTAVMDL